MALIEFQQVAKVYRTGATQVVALDGVDLHIEEGEFVAILGPSGSGKSTLMHLLGFLDRPSAGIIRFDGQELSSLGPGERAAIRSEKVGFVFQVFNLLPRLNVLHNAVLPLSYHRRFRGDWRARGLDALREVGLSHRARHRPSQLSGGERQRVAIARALVNRPRLILADEPTGNLDSKTAQTILDLFAALNRSGRTVVLVTHDPRAAGYAQRRLEMLDGRIVREAHA